MPALLAPGLWSLVASAGLTLSYQGGARVEARAEQSRPAVGENTTIESFEVEPTIGLEGWSPTLRFQLAYAPRFTYLGGDGPDSDRWLHRAWAVARWRPSAAWQLQGNLIGTAGTVDLFRVATAPGLPGEPPPVGLAAPVPATLDYQRYELTLASEGHLGRHFGTRWRLSVMREGGSNAEERLLLPLQQAALVRGELEWSVTGRAALAGLLHASMTHYFDVAVTMAGSSEPQYQSWSNMTARAEAVWRYALTHHTRIWIGAGMAVVKSEAPETGGTLLEPAGEAGFTSETRPGWLGFTGSVVAAVVPVEDRLTGRVAERAEGRAWGTWAIADNWVLGASGMGARVVNGPDQRAAFTAGEMWLTRGGLRHFALTVGGRWTTQWQPQETGRNGLASSMWVAYFSLRASEYGHDPPSEIAPMFF
jgi:hypothetical protein